MQDRANLRANAELAIEQLGPLSDVTDFGFNRQSIAWVEGYIERQRIRDGVDSATVDGLTQVLGSFLGECLILNYRGAWRDDDSGVSVYFDDDLSAYPLNKVRKQFQNGVEGGDSILSFYDSTGALLETKAAESKPPKRWWKLW